MEKKSSFRHRDSSEIKKPNSAETTTPKAVQCTKCMLGYSFYTGSEEKGKVGMGRSNFMEVENPFKLSCAGRFVFDLRNCDFILVVYAGEP